MSTLKVSLMDYETFEDVTADLPRFIDEVYNTKSLHSPMWRALSNVLPVGKPLLDIRRIAPEQIVRSGVQEAEIGA